MFQLLGVSLGLFIEHPLSTSCFVRTRVKQALPSKAYKGKDRSCEVLEGLSTYKNWALGEKVNTVQSHNALGDQLVAKTQPDSDTCYINKQTTLPPPVDFSWGMCGRSVFEGGS